MGGESAGSVRDRKRNKFENWIAKLGPTKDYIYMGPKVISPKYEVGKTADFGSILKILGLQLCAILSLISGEG